MARWRFWNQGILADIECDVFWNNARLQESCFRMLSATSKKTRWFNSEVANFLLSSIQDSPSMLVLKLFFLVLESLRKEKKQSATGIVFFATCATYGLLLFSHLLFQFF